VQTEPKEYIAALEEFKTFLVDAFQRGFIYPPNMNGLLKSSLSLDLELNPRAFPEGMNQLGLVSEYAHNLAAKYNGLNDLYKAHKEKKLHPEKASSAEKIPHNISMPELLEFVSVMAERIGVLFDDLRLGALNISNTPHSAQINSYGSTFMIRLSDHGCAPKGVGIKDLFNLASEHIPMPPGVSR